MNQTKIISPRLTKVLGEEAGFTDKEIELYLTFLRIKTIEKKEVGIINCSFDFGETLT